MPTIRPFRTIDEHNVINLFTWSGAITTAVKETIVKIASGWMSEQNLNELGMPSSYSNTVSQRYGLVASVAPCNKTGDIALGVLLYDVKETDENGERLLFNPTKAAQMQCVLSGQAVPIATRGTFLYSGVNGTPGSAGGNAYLHTDGGLSTAGDPGIAAGVSEATKVGKFLGPKDSNGWVLVDLNFNQ